MIAARAGLERDEEQVRAPCLRVEVLDQESRRAQVLESGGSRLDRQTLLDPRERAVFLAVFGDRDAGRRVVEDLPPVVEIRGDHLCLHDGGGASGGGRRAFAHVKSSLITMTRPF